MLRFISSGCSRFLSLVASMKSKMKSKEKVQNGVTTRAMKSKAISTKNVKKAAKSSKRKQLFLCKICMEQKPKKQMFDKKKCRHSFCSDCISQHIAAKIEENNHNVTCPDVKCKVVLEPQACMSLLPKQVYDRWMDVLCESSLLGMKKVYCPFKTCSAMLLVDDGDKVVKKSECPMCKRLFCAQCNVKWHVGISCQIFKKKRGRKEDSAMVELAMQKKWKRCPNCMFYVEKREGCVHITCRCKFEFCYRCGKSWPDHHNHCD